MTRLVSQAQGLQAAAMQEAEAAGLSVAFGSRVLTTHLAKTTGAPAKALAFDRGVALWLRDFPQLQQGLVDGVLCRSHVLELKGLDNPNIHGLLQRDQALLAQAADTFAWVAWKVIVAYWLNAADPDGVLTDPSDPTHTDLHQGMFRPPGPKLHLSTSIEGGLPTSTTAP